MRWADGRKHGVVGRSWLQGLVLAVVALASLLATARFHDPPRFDGSGYAVLAQALVGGQGYRDIDHPDRPWHAHYPPGYPLALAAIWGVTGASFLAAHVASGLCTVLAVLATWRWFRRLHSSATAWWLALALAVNWRWARDGAVIRTEPLFQLLTAGVLLAAAQWPARRSLVRAAGVGALLGLAILTRHVGVTLAAAVGIDLLLRKRWRDLAVTGLTAMLVVLPWGLWLAWVERPSQAGRLAGGLGLAQMLERLLFLARRIPDQLTGPFVEVGTVFRPQATAIMTTWAVAATGVILLGWWRLARQPRRRLAALVPATTLPLLVVWPFTEAGRFLIPLVPFLLVGACEGLARLGGRRLLGRARRRNAAIVLVLATLPYTVYSAVSDRAGAAERTHAGFDAACRWIAAEAAMPGPVLTRYPGDLFWRTGRLALAVPADADGKIIGDTIKRYGVAYLLVEERPFANAEPDPLAPYAAEHPDNLARVAVLEPGVSVYQIHPKGRSEPGQNTGPRAD